MQTLLRIGSKVSFLGETGQGIVIETDGNQFCVEDEHGFETWYSRELLVPLMEIPEEKLLASKDISLKHNPVIKSSISIQSKGEAEWKIDLHMENLVDSHKGMSNHEIVTLQLKHFKDFIKKAEGSKVRRMIIVHGQGTGKLKGEIKALVLGIKGVEMFDADYTKYGQGASVIERKYNWR
jgi:hypothetical protein